MKGLMSSFFQWAYSNARLANAILLKDFIHRFKRRLRNFWQGVLESRGSLRCCREASRVRKKIYSSRPGQNKQKALSSYSYVTYPRKLAIVIILDCPCQYPYLETRNSKLLILLLLELYVVSL